MMLQDFDGETKVKSKKELERLLTSNRKGRYGAFILSHTKEGPSLWIHILKTMAYLHYFPNPDYLNHAGFRPMGMKPANCSKPVRFRTITGGLIEQPCSSVISLSDALTAAREFFADPTLPASIHWLEL